MDGVKLSVIVPVYNAEQYLRRCVDSILDATIFLGGGEESDSTLDVGVCLWNFIDKEGKCS